MSIVFHRDMFRKSVTDRDRLLVFPLSGVVRYVPLAISGGFFIVTVLLTALGPIDWNLRRPLLVYSFLLACAVFLLGGYHLAVRRFPRAVAATDGRHPLSASLLVVVGSAIYLVLYPVVTYSTTGSWYPDVIRGLQNAGEAYARNKDLNLNASPVPLYAAMLVAPITVLIFPLTLFFWPRLSTAARGMGSLAVLLSVALTIAQGINRGVAETCGYTLLFLVLVATSSLRRGQGRTLTRAVMGMALVIGFFAAYYSVTINSRIGADQRAEGAVRQTNSTKAATVDDAMRTSAKQGVASERSGNPYFQVVPGSLQAEGLAFTSYATQGYHGLSLALSDEFTPTYGLGFSEFFRHNLLRVTFQSSHEETIEERTYSGKLIRAGWPDGAAWSTFFIHPASDISFPGVILLSGLIGVGFGLSWRDALTRYDPLACGVMFHLCILVFYMCANNQLFQGGERAIGFTSLLVAWLLLRRSPRALTQSDSTGGSRTSAQARMTPLSGANGE